MPPNEPIRYVIYALGALVLLVLLALLLKRFLPSCFAWLRDLLRGTLDGVAHRRTLQTAWKDLAAIRGTILLLAAFSLFGDVSKAALQWKYRSEVDAFWTPVEFERFFNITLHAIPQLATRSVNSLYTCLNIPVLAILLYPFLLIGFARLSRKLSERNQTVQSIDASFVTRSIFGAVVLGTLTFTFIFSSYVEWPFSSTSSIRRSIGPALGIALTASVADLLADSTWIVVFLSMLSCRSKERPLSIVVIDNLLTRFRSVLVCLLFLAVPTITTHCLMLAKPFVFANLSTARDITDFIGYTSHVLSACLKFLLVPTLLIIVPYGIKFREAVHRTFRLYRSEPSSILGFLIISYLVFFLVWMTRHTLSQVMNELSSITMCLQSGFNILTILLSALFWAGLLRRIEETETSVAPQPVSVPH